MHIIIGILMFAAGVYLILCAIKRSGSPIYRRIIGKSIKAFGSEVHRNYAIIGLVIAIIGLIIII